MRPYLDPQLLVGCWRDAILSSSTSVLIFGCWPIKNVTYLKLKKNKYCWATDKMTTIFNPNDNFKNLSWIVDIFFCICSARNNSYIFSAWDKSRAFKPTTKNQHKCRGPESSLGNGKFSALDFFLFIFSHFKSVIKPIAKPHKSQQNLNCTYSAVQIVQLVTFLFRFTE